MGTFSIWHWLIVLAIVVVVFGTKKLRNLGSDLGGAVKGFKDGMKDGGTAPAPESRPSRQRKWPTKVRRQSTTKTPSTCRHARSHEAAARA